MTIHESQKDLVFQTALRGFESMSLKQAFQGVWLLKEFFEQASADLKSQYLRRAFSQAPRRDAEEYKYAAEHLGRVAGMMVYDHPLYPIKESADWFHVPEDTIQMTMRRLSGYFRSYVAGTYPARLREEKAQEFAGYAKKIDGILATLAQKGL